MMFVFVFKFYIICYHNISNKLLLTFGIQTIPFQQARPGACVLNEPGLAVSRAHLGCKLSLFVTRGRASSNKKMENHHGAIKEKPVTEE
jgi:hypothetical protein